MQRGSKMRRIRVAFVIDVGWLGGINYFRNLLCAIGQVKDRQIEPVIIIGKKTDSVLLKDLPDFQVIRTAILDKSGFWWKQNSKHNNQLFKWLLTMNRIEILSHTQHVRLGKIKTIGWIPDFQHRYLPDFFSQDEVSGRDRQFMEMAKYSTRLLLSSEDARKDFESFAPDYAHKARVLNFVSIPSIDDTLALEALQRKYQFDRPYFYIPNQFWAHKNHQVVIDALIKLKETIPDVLVIATGSTQDYRNPEYFQTLKEKMEKGGIVENLRILGVIPYQDVVGLLVNARAMINPSLFEGWSTSVEEAKSLGVSMLLSDIAVHLEQAKDSATFFSTNDPASLADKMMEIIDKAKVAKVVCQTSDRDEHNQKRFVAFGEHYQKIVVEMMG